MPGGRDETGRLESREMVVGNVWEEVVSGRWWRWYIKM